MDGQENEATKEGWAEWSRVEWSGVAQGKARRLRDHNGEE
jgi:hypothetical protein